MWRTRAREQWAKRPRRANGGVYADQIDLTFQTAPHRQQRHRYLQLPCAAMYAAMRRAALGAAPLAAAAAIGRGWSSSPVIADAPSAAGDTAPAPVAAAAPPGLHLVHAQVIFRHGARTPVHLHHSVDTSVGFDAPPVLPESAPRVELRHLSTDERMPHPPHESAASPHRFGSRGLPAGALTAAGMAALEEAGRELRRAYVEGGQLVPDGRLDGDSVYLRCVHAAWA